MIITGLSADIPLRQKQALQVFYTEMNGDNWKNNARWNTGDPCTNEWFGITCDTDNTYVKQMVFIENNLTGSIPAELEYLPDLDLLVLIDAGLTGEIPKELGSLNKLMGLILISKDMTGTIPTELGNLPELVILTLISDRFEGEIPSVLANDTKLVELVLAGKDLNGTVPSEIGNLTGLTRLAISGNGITGTIPASFSRLVNLQHLSITNTKMNGELPLWIGTLEDLKNLYITKNRFDGEIKALLEAMTNNELNVTVINLSNNQFSGSLPDSIILWELRKLYLNNNRLSGEVPDLSSLDKLNDGNGLNLNCNSFSTVIPESVNNFILQKSSDFEDWRITQNCRNSNIPILMYLLF
jgi:Leucine-rich repeat (LRR) protein